MDKKRTNILLWALAVSMLLFLAEGAYLKYKILAPLGLYQDKSIAEIPFALLADESIRLAIEDALRGPESPEETTAVTDGTEDTEPSQTTDSPTEPSTAPEITVPPTTENTEPPTAEVTQPPTTEATQPPTTVPPATQPPQTKPPETDPPTPETTAPKVVNPTLEFTGDAVDWSWFDDALFIGDSRTVGLREYARAGNADYFCTVGMSSFNVLKDSTKAADVGFAEQTLMSLLSTKTYGKIFIALGINECGYSTSSIVKQYKKVVQAVRDAQPDAVIILEGIMTTGRKKAASKPHFEPEHIFILNGKIEAIANGVDIFYIDVNEAFADSEGYLPDSFSKDGCHLYAKYTKYWADWKRYAVAALGI